MTTKFLGLRTLGYKVPDLEKAKAWYTQILGVAPYFDQPFYVGFNVGGYELGLQPAAAGEELTSVTYWGVANAQEAYDELIKQGGTPYEKPTDVGDGIVVAAVNDPWGNIVGVIYNPHFKAE